MSEVRMIQEHEDFERYGVGKATHVSADYFRFENALSRLEAVESDITREDLDEKQAEDREALIEACRRMVDKYNQWTSEEE